MFSVAVNNKAYVIRLVASLAAILIAFTLFGEPLQAQSPSHSYINSMRSSSQTHYFVSIGITSLYGDLHSEMQPTASDKKKNKDAEPYVVSEKWQGYGVRNELGIEFLKFLHFSLAHTSLNLRSRDTSTENLSGSRFEATGSLNFYAPLGNLQLGGGMLGSRLDMQNRDQSSDYYGSGYFYNAGYNYFLSNMTSVYLDARLSKEHLTRNSGDELPKSIRTDMKEGGFGFKIWF